MNYLALLKQLEAKKILSLGSEAPPELPKAPFVSSGSYFPHPPKENFFVNEASIKTETLATPLTDLVQEFMEVDGLTLADAQALAEVSVQPLSANKWLVQIAELDALIERYRVVAGLTDEASAAILSVRYGQSLASIPETLAWFRSVLHRMGDPGT